MRLLFFSLAACSLGLGLGLAAHAQSYGGASSSNLLGYRSSAGHYYNRSLGTKIRADEKRQPARRPTTTGRRPSAPSMAPRPGSTSFTPVGPPIIPALLAQQQPADRKGAEAYLLELLNNYKQALRNKGVAPNDVARAASFAVSTSYWVLNEGRDLSPAQIDGLRAQMQRVMAFDPTFQRLKDREKQELYEEYAVISMFMFDLYDVGVRKGDKQRLEAARKLARTQLEDIFSAPPERLSFTNRGVSVR